MVGVLAVKEASMKSERPGGNFMVVDCEWQRQGLPCLVLRRLGSGRLLFRKRHA